MRMRRPGYCVLALVSIAFLAGSATKSESHSGLVPLLYTSTPHYDAAAWMRGADRFAQGASIQVRTGATSQPLVAGFAATADPAVSFDATHVLFSGKRNADDHWQIWETAVNGGVPVQLTSCADDCVRPFYLPGDRLVFARKASGRFEIAVSDRQQNIQQLTYLPGNALPTDVLRDGRILFEAGDPLGSNASSEIFAVYSDGSGVESYRCDHGMARHSGRQLASGDIVFAKDNGLARFTSALAHEVDVPNAK
jgi:hypothetical protein